MMPARAVAAGDAEGVLRQRMREVTSRLLVRHFSSIPADQACSLPGRPRAVHGPRSTWLRLAWPAYGM